MEPQLLSLLLLLYSPYLLLLLFLSMDSSTNTGQECPSNVKVCQENNSLHKNVKSFVFSGQKSGILMQHENCSKSKKKYMEAPIP